jgi:hypothetical protein
MRSKSIVAASMLLGVTAMCARAADQGVSAVALAMTVTLDTVNTDPSTPSTMTIGQVDRLRIVYDANAVDPRTKHVKLLNFQHFNNGGYAPPKPDPVEMPLTDAWLDLASKPYRLHFRAAVVHGNPILIDVSETTRRLTIHPQDRPGTTLIAGPYVIDPKPITGPAILEAAGHT